MFNGKIMLGFITKFGKAVYDRYKASSERSAELNQIKMAGEIEIAKAKTDFKVAKMLATAERTKRESMQNLNYDMQVLKNRRETLSDEFIILGFFMILILTFVPHTQHSMVIGWEALKHAPWWFEFGIVGILVSTLGLKDVLRMFLNAFPNRKKDTGTTV